MQTDALEVLARVPTEIEACAMVQFLASYDIEATQVGGYTAGFKAEAPGLVSVLVKHGDLERAKQALTEVPEEWSAEDVDEPETIADEETSEQLPPAAHARPAFAHHLWWGIEIIGLAVIVLAYLFTGKAALLGWLIPVLVLLGFLVAWGGTQRR